MLPRHGRAGKRKHVTLGGAWSGGRSGSWIAIRRQGLSQAFLLSTRSVADKPAVTADRGVGHYTSTASMATRFSG